jgi:DNA repair exonuclease SbcCD ATPase subunit
VRPIDRLYELPLEEFTKARDELARRLTAAGDAKAAAEVKRARKPTLPAWAANQVVRKAPEEWERLRRAVRELRERHGRRGAATSLREAARAQSDALKACERQAARLLAEHGHPAGPALLHTVVRTLLALAHGAPGATPGRLERPLEPPGFEALAGVAPPAAASSQAAIERSGSRPKADEARAAALRAARMRREKAQARVLEARTRLAAEDRRVKDLERQLEAAHRARDQARRELRSAESDPALREPSPPRRSV